MPLSDLVRTLNAPSGVFPRHYSRSGLDQPFVAVDGRVFLHYANIRIDSVFLPVIETASGKQHGHVASFQAIGLKNRIPLLPEALFALPTDDEEFVYLDRLLRTLHALNYLTRPTRGNLLLKVHTRHVLSVPAHHGLAFEEILRPCGLFPEQVTLEINADAISDTAHLIRAVTSYRSRGYGIAISNLGRTRLDYTLLRELQPDIVRLDASLLTESPQVLRIIESLRQLPCRVLIEGKDIAQLSLPDLATEIDLLQANAPTLKLLQRQPETSAKSIRDAA